VYNLDIDADEEAAPAVAAKKTTKPAILMTGATHARELISTTQNLYEIMKLIKLGWIEQDPEELKLLNQNRFLFMPILNVDGVAMIE
jgi:murein tripeptide amidase MpaA